ncbi:GtrA-like protein [compost metagenome]
MDYSWAVTVAYAVGLLCAFLLNRRYVFPNSTKPVASQAREFILVNLAFFPVVWGTAIAFRHFLVEAGFAGVADGLAHAFSLAIPSLATFLIYKFSTFGGTHAD